jgi:hypothetical protein
MGTWSRLPTPGKIAEEFSSSPGPEYRCLKAVLNVVEAAERTLNDPEDLTRLYEPSKQFVYTTWSDQP